MSKVYICREYICYLGYSSTVKYKSSCYQGHRRPYETDFRNNSKIYILQGIYVI